MPRKPTPQSPPLQAISKLAQLTAAGTTAAWMERAARAIVAEWRVTADSDIARRWTEVLLSDIRTGLAEAEEQVDNVDTSDGGAAKQAAAVVAGLRATEGALAGELARM